jgi:hypothetical protein
LKEESKLAQQNMEKKSYEKIESSSPKARIQNKGSRNMLVMAKSEKIIKNFGYKGIKKVMEKNYSDKIKLNSTNFHVKSVKTSDEHHSPSIKNNVNFCEKRVSDMNSTNIFSSKRIKYSKLKLSVDYSYKKDTSMLKKCFIPYSKKSIKSPNNQSLISNQIVSNNNLKGYLNFKSDIGDTKTPKHKVITEENTEPAVMSSQFNNYKQLTLKKNDKQPSDNKDKLQNRNLINYLSNSNSYQQNTSILTNKLKNKIKFDNYNTDTKNSMIKEKNENSMKKSSTICSSNTTLIGNSISNQNKKKQSQPSEISINLKDIIEINTNAKSELNSIKPKKINESELYEEKKNFDTFMLNNNLSRTPIHEEEKYTPKKDFFHNMIDYSYENANINKDKEYSDSGIFSTKKSEVSDRNDLFLNDGLFEKINKKDIMYTNEISFDSVDEKLKNIIFKKN